MRQSHLRKQKIKISTKKSKKRIKYRKNKLKNKSKKMKYYKIKNQGGSIIGLGKDGCIIDSISCNELSPENGFVSKFLYDDKKINIELNNKLASLDPNNERYNRYYLPNTSSCIEKENYTNDFETCSKNGKISISNMVFQRKLEPLDEKKLTKIQYRYLRDSLNLLHDNNISHRDLPGNVMINPNNNMPVIIDWEDAKLEADIIDKKIDTTAFLNHFKVKKI